MEEQKRENEKKQYTLSSMEFTGGGRRKKGGGGHNGKRKKKALGMAICLFNYHYVELSYEFDLSFSFCPLNTVQFYILL